MNLNANKQWWWWWWWFTAYLQRHLSVKSHSKAPGSSDSHYQFHICRKRYVLRSALNVSRSSILRRMTGREFQSLGATVENARSPYVFRRVFGTRRLSPDVRKPGRNLRSSMGDEQLCSQVTGRARPWRSVGEPWIVSFSWLVANGVPSIWVWYDQIFSSSLAIVRQHFGQPAVDLEMKMADQQEDCYKSQVVRWWGSELESQLLHE